MCPLQVTESSSPRESNGPHAACMEFDASALDTALARENNHDFIVSFVLSEATFVIPVILAIIYWCCSSYWESRDQQRIEAATKAGTDPIVDRSVQVRYPSNASRCGGAHGSAHYCQDCGQHLFHNTDGPAAAYRLFQAAKMSVVACGPAAPIDTSHTALDMQ